MRSFFTFGPIKSIDYGVWISGEGTFNRPKRAYTEKTIPGRNGTLLIDEGRFLNVDLVYPAFIADDMPGRIDAFLNDLASMTGYQRLEDTYHPYEFRMAQFTGEVKVQTEGYMNRHGGFNISFNTMPQRYLKSGEKAIAFTANGTILNRTQMPSKPFLRVFGSAAGTVGIGSQTITISAIDGYVDIDCEIMDAYKGTTNCNGNVAFTGPITIPAGAHGITMTGGITKVEISPRWYIL